MIKVNNRKNNDVRGTCNSLTEVSEVSDLSTEGMLQAAVSKGIINIADVEETLRMKQREEILNNHPYSIWQGKNNGKWYTYIPDENKVRKMTLKKRNSREDIENLIITYWKKKQKEEKTQKERENKHTFMDVYYMWRKLKDQMVSVNTVAKYESDRKRFFDGKELSEMDIKEIDRYAVEIFMSQNIRDHELQKEAMRKLFGYVVNTMNFAREKNLIECNPIEYMTSKSFYQQCYEKYKPKNEQVIPREDMQQLQGQFRRDHENKENYMPTYAVEFASLTGMRVSEISALRWDHIYEDYILIEYSEKSNPQKNSFWIDRTKNKRARTFPMTNEIRRLLKKVKEVEQEYGYLCDWVFADEDGRIHGPRISACSKTKCRQLKLNSRGKGIHGYRKTLNSKMRCMGVPVPQAAAMLGHTKEVNERYYTFDVSELQEKSQIVSRINQETLRI